MAKNDSRPKQTVTQKPTIQSATPQHRPQQQITVQQSSFSGPLPPPETLASYNAIMPGAADRIIKMAEAEAEHRHDQECRALAADILINKIQAWETVLGQLLGFSVAVFTIGAGAYAAIHGAQIAGSLMGSAGVIGLATVFIMGRRKQ